MSNVSTIIDGSINGLLSFETFSKSNSNFPLSIGIILSTENANSACWDGTFNGAKMPTTDYWFLAKIKKLQSSLIIKVILL